MVDTYRFSIPIEFSFRVPGGESNLDYREQLKTEVMKVVHTMLRGQDGDILFEYPVEFEDKRVEAKCWLGYLGTKHAPNRFRSRDVQAWIKICYELQNRSKNKYDGYHKGKKLLKKADVPFYVGRTCYTIGAWLQKYSYVTFRQQELLEFWATEYKTKAGIPKPKPSSKKPKPKTKMTKAWSAMAITGHDDPDSF